jgi:hypothetical protein
MFDKQKFKIRLVIKRILRSGFEHVYLYRDLSFSTEDKDGSAMVISRVTILSHSRNDVIFAIDAWMKGIPADLYSARPGQSSRGALVRMVENITGRKVQ